MTTIRQGLIDFWKLIWGEKTRISSSLPLLFWFGVFFCFILFPFFLVDVGLDSYLDTKKSLEKKDLFKKLNNRLELLLQYGNSRHYYHAVLKRIVDLAEKTSNPTAYLQRALAHLKKRNPGVFRFIVWDDKGRIIDNLTDEKSYKYIIKTMYDAFALASKDILENYPGNPGALTQIDKKINLLRSYLGAFFIQERMNLPFLRGILGECIMASSLPERSHFWYRVNDRFGIFVNIHSEAIESNNYFKKIITGLNRDTSGIKCGMAELIRDRKVFTDKVVPFKRELLIELGKFAGTSESEVETSNQLLVIKPITPFVLGFCTIPTKGNLIEKKETRYRILAGTSIAFALVGILAAYIIFKSGFFSIRWKLAVLFIYANGLPLLILGFLGFDYMQQVRMQLLDRAQNQISDLLKEFDSKFVRILQRFENEANQIRGRINQKFADEKITETDFTNFEDEIMKLRPNDLIVADNVGKFKIFRCSGRRADKFISNMAQGLLEFANEKEYVPFVKFNEDMKNRDGKIKAQTLMSNKAIVFDEVLSKTNKIAVQQMGSEERFYYWAFIGNEIKRQFDYLCMVSWSQHYLQEVYLQEFLDSYNQNAHGIKLFAMVETNGVTYPESNTGLEIDTLFRQVFNLKVVRSDAVRIGDDHFVAYGSVGKMMNKVAMIGIFPGRIVDDHITSIKFRLVIFAMLSVFMTTGIGMLLARQFLEPVKELENGVKAIGEQNFRYRIPISGADEFGHLGGVFNRAIESLEDLEVAKIVQENLFPSEPMVQGNLEVFGRSVSMTRLGGDYYDYFNIDNDYAGVLMGDVAGHGVPAALLMAMAKASVLLADDAQRHSPGFLLEALHKVIYRVKSSKIKRMMTCQYFAINTGDGSFKFANAGHCFPALIKNRGRSIEQLKQVGTPLGITKKAKYKEEQLNLEEGDIVLLYTDGIIESKNRDGLELGFERFEQLVLDSYDDNLENFYQKIFDGYLHWTPTAEDDITMILFRYQSKGLKE
ncbi:MAG: SpoIIE family protein phosphatase [Candidatus Rifleibacteriota bacterium]